MGWETSFSIYFLCFAISLSRPVITDTVCHSIKQYFFVTDIYSTTKPSLKYWSLFFNLEYFWGRKKITDVWNLFPCNPLPSFFLCLSPAHPMLSVWSPFRSLKFTLSLNWNARWFGGCLVFLWRKLAECCLLNYLFFTWFLIFINQL